MNRTRKLTVRTDRGHIDPPAATYSSGPLQRTLAGLAPVCDTDLIEAALAVLAKRVSRGSVLDSPNVVKNFLITRLTDLEHEIFGLVLLTTRHTLIDFVELFRGTIDGASVHPREVVKLVLSRNDTYSLAEAGRLLYLE
jgi:DNA repair protein RadC